MKEQLLKYWKDSKIVTNKNLLKAFSEVDRTNFVLESYKYLSYSDVPLPIGFGQTISQPTTVMLMIQALKLRKKDVVLEVGAGSGYNAAIMSKLCKFIYARELIPSLVEFAKENLFREGIRNVEVGCSDGSKGYKVKAPYNKIIVTAACPEIPKPLVEQLKENGKIIAPVGLMLHQEMFLGVKNNGRLELESLGYFSFVPLKGKFGLK